MRLAWKRILTRPPEIPLTEACRGARVLFQIEVNATDAEWTRCESTLRGVDGVCVVRISDTNRRLPALNRLPSCFREAGRPQVEGRVLGVARKSWSAARPGGRSARRSIVERPSRAYFTSSEAFPVATTAMESRSGRATIDIGSSRSTLPCRTTFGASGRFRPDDTWRLELSSCALTRKRAFCAREARTPSWASRSATLTKGLCRLESSE